MRRQYNYFPTLPTPSHAANKYVPFVCIYATYAQHIQMRYNHSFGGTSRAHKKKRKEKFAREATDTKQPMILRFVKSSAVCFSSQHRPRAVSSRTVHRILGDTVFSSRRCAKLWRVCVNGAVGRAVTSPVYLALVSVGCAGAVPNLQYSHRCRQRLRSQQL